jgi:hypothetical protein
LPRVDAFKRRRAAASLMAINAIAAAISKDCALRVIETSRMAASLR